MDFAIALCTKSCSATGSSASSDFGELWALLIMAVMAMSECWLWRRAGGEPAPAEVDVVDTPSS